jgi:hypothetical protein
LTIFLTINSRALHFKASFSFNQYNKRQPINLPHYHSNTHPPNTQLTPPIPTTTTKMSSGAAFFLAHDAHRPDSRAAEASYSRRTSLNPFHHNKYSEEHPETQQERRRSSVVEFVKKVVHAGQHEGDYRASVEEGERGRKGSQEHEDAVNTAQAATENAATTAPEAAPEAEALKADEQPRRRSSIAEELKEEVKLVKKQQAREKVPVAF